MFVDLPMLASPIYERWFTLEFLLNLLFLISTKFPTFAFFSKIVPGLNLAKGPTTEPLSILTPSKWEKDNILTLFFIFTFFPKTT